MEYMFSVKDKVVVITGAGKGIGRALAIGFAQHGAYVECVDICFPDAVPPELCFNMSLTRCDILDQTSFDNLCYGIFIRRKKIDCLINCAGISLPTKKDEEYSKDSWDKTISVNLTGAFLCSQTIFKYMKNCGEGSIINITSINAEMAFPNNPGYVASKGGLKMLGKALALDYGEHNIRVNNVAPGYIRTDMTSASYSDDGQRENRVSHTILNRCGEPQDIIGVCIFLSSAAAAYITGQDICVDGGWVVKGL